MDGRQARDRRGAASSRMAFQSTAWFQAASLSERRGAVRAARGGLDLVAGCGELVTWRAQPPFDDPTVFARRLAADGMSEADFARALSVSPELLARTLPFPGWLDGCRRAFARHGVRRSAPLDELGLESGEAEMLEVLRPLVEDAWSRLRAGVERAAREGAPRPLEVETVLRSLFAALPARLLAVFGRAFVLELNVARVRRELRGAGSVERFHDFVARFANPDQLLGLLAAYPLMTRQLWAELERWIEDALEPLQRLAADGPRLATLVAPDEPLVAARQLPDRRGRPVTVLRFAGGGRLAFVPRPLGVDAHFQELLRWVGARGFAPGFRPRRVVDRGPYGWAEPVEPAPCGSPAAARRYRRRLGGTLALLWACEAALEPDDLVACGEHPLLRDLGGLFHGRPAGPPAAGSADGSVLRVGLLGPSRAESATGDVPAWEDPGTDRMRVARGRGEEARSGDGGEDGTGGGPRTAARVEDVAGGFGELLDLLREERAALLAADGPLAAFAGDAVRASPRPTRAYRLFLAGSHHPDLQRDALELERFLDRLWVGVERAAHRIPLIPAEREALWRGELPVFASRPASRDLWTADGERIAGHWPRSAMAVARARLRTLDADERERQLDRLRRALAAGS